MGKRGIRGLKTRVGRECSIKGGPDCTVEVYRSEEEVTVLRVGMQRGGTLQE